MLSAAALCFPVVVTLCCLSTVQSLWLSPFFLSFCLKPLHSRSALSTSVPMTTSPLLLPLLFLAPHPLHPSLGEVEDREGGSGEEGGQALLLACMGFTQGRSASICHREKKREKTSQEKRRREKQRDEKKSEENRRKDRRASSLMSRKKIPSKVNHVYLEPK